MAEHEHRYKVSKDSVFGLKNIHAVMECVGVVDRKSCNARLTKIVGYDELEKTGTDRPQYFYKEPVAKAEGETQWVK